MSEKDIKILNNENILLREHIARLKYRLEQNNKRIPYLTDFYEQHKESIFDRMLELGMDVVPLLNGGYNNRPLTIIPKHMIKEAFDVIRKNGVAKVTFGYPFDKVFLLDVLKDENIDELEEFVNQLCLRITVYSCGNGIPTPIDYSKPDVFPILSSVSITDLSEPEWKHEITDTPPSFHGDFAAMMDNNPPVISEETMKLINESIERDGIDISIRKEI